MKDMPLKNSEQHYTIYWYNKVTGQFGPYRLDEGYPWFYQGDNYIHSSKYQLTFVAYSDAIQFCASQLKMHKLAFKEVDLVIGRAVVTTTFDKVTPEMLATATLEEIKKKLTPEEFELLREAFAGQES